MTPEQGLAFVQHHGVVLQATRGPMPSLAEAVAGPPVRGCWWGHAKGREIYRVATAVGESEHVLVCRLVDGKVTYVHRRLWPALVRLAGRFRPDRLAKVWNEHTATGAHRAREVPFPAWVPAEVVARAQRLSAAAAERLLAACLDSVERPTTRSPTTKARRTRRPRP